jgi:hypothetical protein
MVNCSHQDFDLGSAGSKSFLLIVVVMAQALGEVASEIVEHFCM